MNIDKLKTILPNVNMQDTDQCEFLDLGLPSYMGIKLLTYIKNDKFFALAQSNKAIEVILVPSDFEPKISNEKVLIRSDDPQRDFFKLHKHLASKTNFYGEDFLSRIDQDCDISPSAYVADKNVIIEKGVKIMPGAVILEKTILRQGVTIGPNTVIGFEGTQRIAITEGVFERVEHVGGVTIEKDSFIGANSVIVRGLFNQPTMIGSEVNVGNLVNVGHGCSIGNQAMLLSHSVICGSTMIHESARVSPGAVVSNGLEVGKYANIKIGAVVVNNVGDNQELSGNFAVAHKKNLKNFLRENRK